MHILSFANAGCWLADFSMLRGWSTGHIVLSAIPERVNYLSLTALTTA